MKCQIKSVDSVLLLLDSGFFFSQFDFKIHLADVEFACAQCEHTQWGDRKEESINKKQGEKDHTAHTQVIILNEPQRIVCVCVCRKTYCQSFKRTTIRYCDWNVIISSAEKTCEHLKCFCFPIWCISRSLPFYVFHFLFVCVCVCVLNSKSWCILKRLSNSAEL